MAIRVPQAERRVQQDTLQLPVQQVAQPVRGAFGEDVARSGQDIAQGISDIGQAVKKRADEKRTLDNLKKANQVDMQFNMDVQSLMNSADDEEFVHNGNPTTRPKGILNRKNYQAQGSVDEYDSWFNKNAMKYAEAIEDPDIREKMLGSIQNTYLSQRKKVISHQATQETNDIVQTATASQILTKDMIYGSSDLNEIKQGIAKTVDLQNQINVAKGIEGEAAEAAKMKAKTEAMSSVINGALDRDMTGVEAKSILDTFKDDISNEAYSKAKTVISKKVTAMENQVKENIQKEQYNAGAKLILDIASGTKSMLANEDEIKSLGSQGVISKELDQAIDKATYSTIVDYDDEGKDLAFVDFTRRVLTETDVEAKNKMLAEMVDEFSGNEKYQRKLQLMVQAAMEIENDANKKQALEQSIQNTLRWGFEAGIQNTSSMVEDSLNGILKGEDPTETLDVTIKNEVARQQQLKAPFLDNQLSDFILLNTGNDDVSFDDAEQGVYQYLLKSGRTKEEAAKVSSEIFMSGTVEEVQSKMNDLLPELRLEIPKTKEKLDQYSQYLQVLEQINPFYTSEAEAGDLPPIKVVDQRNRPEVNFEENAFEIIDQQNKSWVEKSFLKMIIMGGSPVNYSLEGLSTVTNKALSSEFGNDAIDILTGGMTIEEADAHADDVINKLQEIPGDLGAIAVDMKDMFIDDLKKAETFIKDPIKGLMNLAKPPDSNKPINPRVYKGLGKIVDFAFAPYMKAARFGGGLVSSEQGNDLKGRMTQAFRDVIQEPGVGAYAERFVESQLTGKESKEFSDAIVNSAAVYGTALEMLTFSRPIKHTLRSLQTLRAKDILNTQKAILQEVNNDIPKIKDVIKEYAKNNGIKVNESALNKVVTPEFVINEANRSVAFGNYLKGVTNKVAPRFTLRSQRGSIPNFFKKSDDFNANLKNAIESGVPESSSGATALRALTKAGLSNAQAQSSGISAFLENKENVTKEELMQFAGGGEEQSLMNEARKYGSAEEFVDDNIGLGLEGSMQHRPTFTRATADNITQEVSEMGLPEDFYDNPRLYETGDKIPDSQSIKALLSVRGNPEAEVTIYRASPKKELRVGDWVTLSKEYAKGESLQEGSQVYSFKVKAKDIHFAGDSINEFGYYPESEVKKLTDIYNKANASNAPLTAAEAVEQGMSKEEWVQINEEGSLKDYDDYPIIFYHGTTEKFHNFEFNKGEEEELSTIWFSKDEEVAEKYVKAGFGKYPRIIESKIDQSANIFDTDKEEHRKIFDQLADSGELDWAVELGINDKGGKYPLYHSNPFLIPKLQEMGFDGVYVIDAGGEDTVGIFNLDKIKTKSQLEAEYDAAQAGLAGNPPTEPPKTTFAMPDEPEGWDDAFNSLTSKELKGYVQTIDNHVKGKIKPTGIGEEENLIPKKFFAKEGGQTLDELVGEVANELGILGYEQTGDGLRAYIMENHVKDIDISGKEQKRITKQLAQRRKESLRAVSKVERILGKAPVATKTTVRQTTGQTDLSDKITMSERKALKNQLLSQSRAAKLAERVSRNTIQEAQARAVEFINGMRLEPKDKAKFLASIKRVKDNETLAVEMKTIAKRASQYAESLLKNNLENQINKEIKRTAPLKKDNRKIGRYNYEDNKHFAEVTRISKLNKKAAMDEVLRSNFQPETEQERMLLRLKSLKAAGKNASVELYEQVLKDIQRTKLYGQMAKTEADFFKALERGEDAQEALAGLDKIDAQIKFTPTGNVAKDLVERAKTAKTIAANVYREGFSNHYSMMNSVFGKKFAERYDPEIPESNMSEAIYGVVKEAQNVGADIYGIQVNKFLDQMINLSKEDFTITDFDGLSKEISKLDIMDIFNGIKNDNTKEQFYRVYGENQIDTLLRALSPEDMAFANYMQGVVQGYRPVFNEKSIRINGRDLGIVEGYWPRTSEKPVDIYDDFVQQSNLPSAMKERAGNVIPVPTNAWHKFNRHINQGEHTRYLSEPYENIKRIYTNRAVKNEIINKYGKDVYNTMLKQLEDISLNQITNSLDFISKTFGKAINNWVLSKVALNPGVFLKQLVSTSNYMENMPVGDWAKGFTKGISTPKETFDFMWKNAPFLEARFQRGYSEALSQAINDANKMSSGKANWANMLSSMTRSGDIAAIIYGGYPMVKYHLDQGKSMAYAINEFKKSTLKSQQSGLKSSLSQFQNNLSPLTRLFLAFKNTPTQYMRKIVDNMIAYQNGDQDLGQTTKGVTIFGVIQPMLWIFAGASVREMYKGAGRAIRGEADLTEDEQIAKDILIEIASSPANAVPILGDLWKASLRRASGQYAFSPFDSPMLSDFEKAWAKSQKKEITLEDYLQIGSTITEVTTGAPTGTALRIGKYLFKPDNNRFKNFINETETIEHTPNQVNAFFNELDKAVEKKQIEQDKANYYMRDYIRSKYDMEGQVYDVLNIEQMKEMPEDLRDKLISTYAESTQKKLKQKLKVQKNPSSGRSRNSSTLKARPRK